MPISASELSVQLNSQHKLGVTMDGSKGADIFSTITVGAIRSLATSADVDVDIILLDPKNTLVGELDLAFSEETGLWELSGPGLSSSVTGENLIKTKGFEIDKWQGERWRQFQNRTYLKLLLK